GALPARGIEEDRSHRGGERNRGSKSASVCLDEAPQGGGRRAVSSAQRSGGELDAAWRGVQRARLYAARLQGGRVPLRSACRSFPRQATAAALAIVRSPARDAVAARALGDGLGAARGRAPEAEDPGGRESPPAAQGSATITPRVDRCRGAADR